jgi:GAF domain-containing protein
MARGNEQMTQVLDDTVGDPSEIIADLQRKLDESRAELSEAQERETATAEVLGVINSSPGELAPVFDAMLERAMRLCEAAFGSLAIYRDGRFHLAASRGVPERYVETLRTPWETPPGGALNRLVEGDQIVHIVDISADAAFRSGLPLRVAMVEQTGAKTALWVALRRDETLIGTFVIYRTEVRPFSDKQIALLENFAAQAVIAIENARLITETREALDQQTATAEVLGVINSSPGDLTPVFNAILEKAHTLCGATHGGLLVFEGEEYRVAAVHGNNPLTEYWRQLGRVRLSATENTPVPRLMRGERFVHLADARADDGYHDSDRYRQLIDLAGARTLLAVPLRKEKDNVLLGVITAFRQEVRPFSDKQIGLLETFAAQAVIAMENARLITETREALEQQTATAEVLGVINASPGDLAPVFDAILEKAHNLCAATYGGLLIRNGDDFNVVAIHGEREFAEYWRQ